MKKTSGRISDEAAEIFAQLIDLIDDFCEKHLNEDYRQLCEQMADELCFESSLLKKGKVSSWAGGIVHAVGWVNFIGDPATEPYMTSSELAASFGVSQSTMVGKSKVIRDELDLMPMDPDWCLPELLDDNPLVWMVEVNGLYMDIRTMPRNVQEAAYDQGLIPYIPADREDFERKIPIQEIAESNKPEAKIIKFPVNECIKNKVDNTSTLFD